MVAEKIYRGLVLRKLADRSEGERVERLRVPPSAVRSDGGDLIIDPSAAQRFMLNPDTPGYEHEPWPTAGMRFEGEPETHARIPTSTVAVGVEEGWISLEGERVVHRPGGPPENPWKVTHTFRHADAIVLHMVDGDYRYRVVENPDKWPERKDDDPSYPDGLGFGGDVRWYYDAELEV